MYPEISSWHICLVNETGIVLEIQFLLLHRHSHIMHTGRVFHCADLTLLFTSHASTTYWQMYPQSIPQWFTLTAGRHPLSVVSRFPMLGTTAELALNSQHDSCREAVHDSYTKWPVLHMAVSQFFAKQASPDSATQTSTQPSQQLLYCMLIF